MIKQFATIDDINNAWIEQGQKVSDLDAQLNAAVMDDNFDSDKFAELKANRDNAKAHRDALKDQKENMQAQLALDSLGTPDPVDLTKNQQKAKAKFLDNFKGLIMGDAKIVNEVTSSTDADGNQIGLTIPTDIQTAIHTLVRQYQSMEQFVNVESTSMPTGSRVWEKWTDVTPLADLDDETATIGDNDDPRLTLIKYAIHRYAGITTITNTLLKDTAENLLSWLNSWIAKKVVVTRNVKILEVFETAENVAITKFDDLKDLELVKLDPAINATAQFITNQSGFAVLAKVKDALGHYMLQRDPTAPENYLIGGKHVTVIADRWLKDDDAGNHPLYYGDGKQFATLFDREQMSLLVTNIGAGAFENDSTKIRVIDRFDVQPTDTEAMVKATFTKIADQPSTLTGTVPDGGSTETSEASK